MDSIKNILLFWCIFFGIFCRASAEVRNVFPNEQFEALSQMFMDSELCAHVSIEKADCHLLPAEEACLRESINNYINQDLTLFESFLNKVLRNPQWILYVTNIASHSFNAYQKSFHDDHAYQLTPSRMHNCLYTEAFLMYLFSSLFSIDEEFEGHRNCFDSSRQNFYKKAVHEFVYEDTFSLIVLHTFANICLSYVGLFMGF